MSNYPNMRYCMCENTLAAVNQVLEAMQEDGIQFLREMNRHEYRAFQELFNACEEFLVLSEEPEDRIDSENDGQPTEAQEWRDYDPDC